MLLAGVDEVGRGPLVGPVVAAAVILDPAVLIEGITDSKKVSEKKRPLLAEQIKQSCISWAIGQSSAQEIDILNIHQATLLAMKRAVEGLSVQPTHVCVDGKFCPEIAYPCEAIIKGDSKVIEIAAASIVAKVTRDEWMMKLHEKHPQYGFAQHKGYPTKLHIENLNAHGVLAEYRQSFGPVKALLQSVS